ncbi:MAG TPA: DUF4382 domain-containing protein [Candidatus Binatia bacterium]
MNSRLNPRAVRPSIYSRILFLTLVCLAAPLAGAKESQGILEVRIKDHREAIGDFGKVTLTIGEILISPKPGLKFWQSSWKSLAAAPESIDLTQYVDKNSVAVFRGYIDIGSFDAVHLKLKEVIGILKKSQREAHIKNTVGPIKLSFEVRAQGETKIVLDLVVMDMSDHPPRGYELAVKGYEIYTNGKLMDRIPPGS